MMEYVRKHMHRDSKTGREIVYVVGSKVCGGRAKISKILNLNNDTGKEVTYVYVENDKKESCIWKRIVIIANNVIEMEYDWNELIGYDSDAL